MEGVRANPHARSCQKSDSGESPPSSENQRFQSIMSDPVTLLQQLVQLPSVSPMGSPLPENSGVLGERRVTAFLAEWARERGLAVARQTVWPNRENIVILLPGEAETLLWEVHQDTVPVDGMVIEPFGGDLRDGRVWGRGASDVKGTMACMLSAVERLLAQDKPHATLLLACTVDEEQGGAGAIALPQLWQHGELPQPSAAVVAEPTGLDVVVAHKGVVRWKCRTTGVAVHSSTPHQGDNAIYRMARVVQLLERYHVNVLAEATPHPLLGPPSLSVGVIHGGAGVNVVPDQCEIEIDRRLLPGESPDQAQADVLDYLSQHDAGDERVIHESPYLKSAGLSDANNAGLAERMSAAAQTVGARGERLGVAFGTDASRLAPHLPCVVFGAGDIAQAHTKDEWIAVEQLRDCTEALVRSALV